MAKAERRTILQQAVVNQRGLTWASFMDRVFAYVFKGLVYPQIWEDPEVDIKALAIQPGNVIVTIASGGCNALSYLTEDPGRIEAVDLNEAHVALNRLKLSAAENLPGYESFHRFFGKADDKANVAAYHRFIAPNLDAASRAYWEKRKWNGRMRISLFSRDLYQHGLLGWFIGAAHRVARWHGVDPADMLRAKTMAEQRTFFDTALSPLFDRRIIKWATARKASLFGLGIPPAQYEALASAGGGSMTVVLRERLEKLSCGFLLSENYFAQQAFGRSYGADGSGPLPPYLKAEHFETIRRRAHRMTCVNASLTTHLADKAPRSVDRVSLLDAQDWMNGTQLNDLWREITRTANPGARVIFRTAAVPTILPGRVDPAILDRWEYLEAQSAELHAQDRSSIYGGFHIYALKDAAA
jgi:S-adenosylmethionine-diacylglycerol 3-amino-3-carboxypropyl transferase